MSPDFTSPHSQKSTKFLNLTYLVFLNEQQSFDDPTTWSLLQVVKQSVHSFSSVAQLCPTLCNPVDCSMPGFPVHHQLPELAQTHVPSHPLLSLSPPACSLSQFQGLF